MASYSLGNLKIQFEKLIGALFSKVYFDVMLSCWNSDPAARKVPQAIMKDMNQILYRVFNSKKLPNYVSIEGFSPEVEAGNGCAETPATGCEDKGKEMFSG